MGYYAPIFYFHLVLGVAILMLVIFPSNIFFTTDLKDTTTINPIYLYINLISLITFLLVSLRFRPSKVRYAIEQNQEVWSKVLGHSQIPALYISLDSVKSDTALHAGNRGARKIVVTDIIPSKEEEAENVLWSPPDKGEKSKVKVMPDTEVAFFTHVASQDRHCHEIATEIYVVMDGTMLIEVDEKEYSLSLGDMIIVNPNIAHQVKPEGYNFICCVLSINSGGATDKYNV
jgi:mannose-6-phosphate isomerase-like protein (cupin superfamily)